jgi:membrane protein required for colicin V production
MTEFDYIVLAVLAISVALSMFRGLVREVLSLANWVLAFYVANHYAHWVVDCFESLQSLSEPMQILASSTIAFMVSLLIGGVLTVLISRLIAVVGLGLIDRVLGVLFGVLRGLLIVLAAMIVAGFTSLPEKQFWREAIFSPYAEQSVRMIKPWLPPNVAHWIKY